MPLYCDVGLRLPARQWFTYLLPQALESLARPGMRVAVPLRRETAVGVIGRLHDERPAVEAREVLDLVDLEPVLPPELLKLGAWIASYYFCSPGEALFAMVPVGLSRTVETVYSHEPERVPTAALKPAERRLCLYLAEHPGASRSELLSTFTGAGTSGRLARLAAQGTVTLQRRILPRHKLRRTETAVEWAGPAPEGPFADDPLAQYLAAAGGPVASRALKERFPESPRRLLRLSRRRLVRSVHLPAPYEPQLPELEPAEEYRLTPAQTAAVQAITAGFGAHRTFLLYGITGSGKTEVYIHALRRVLEAGSGALYLVPEIGLANHLLARLAAHFRSRIVILHSGLTEKERALAWDAVRRGERTLVVGTRSAVFAPIKDLRLIVVDEEQDPSLKQDDPSPRYHARDVAVWRAQQERAVCVLGTATPSLETWHNVVAGKYRLLELPERIGQKPLPRITLIDRRRERPRHAGGLVTEPLAARLAAALARKGQAILFLNRRGFSGALRCACCGHVPACPDCSVAYSFHRDRRQLRCHFCGSAMAAPERCPACEGTDFHYPRAGTQQVEHELRALFPTARVARLDLDVAASRGRSAEILGQFGRRAYDILLGTQMVTKGLHFPHVAVVGILNADLSLDLPDFRASERTLQLILQVAGRAGRGEQPGEVLVQTFQPDAPVYRFVVASDYGGFAATELEMRRALAYPPGGRLVAVTALGVDDEATREAIESLAVDLRRTNRPVAFALLGPAPAPLKRLRRHYRWQMLLKTGRIRPTLARLDSALTARKAGRVRFNVDVDPVHLL
jgi:primosomal protein N' (replication factor Y)